jgi:hypothetical protein
VTYSFIQVTGQPVPTGYWVYVYQAVPTPNGVADPQAAGYTTYSFTQNGAFESISIIA